MRIEVRTCIHCGETKEIVQKYKFATNICNQCRSKKANDYNKARALANGRRPATTGRRPYPLRDGYKTTGPMFKAMSTQTKRCKTKEEWRALMGERLEEVLNNADLPKIFEEINPLMQKHGLGFTQLINSQDGLLLRHLNSSNFYSIRE